MYPSKFDYHRPSSVQEAVQILSSNPDAKVLAGGHSLIPVMKLRLAAPAALVDIGRIDALHGINLSNGSLSIGACVTYNEIANSADVQAAAPLLAEAAGQIGDRQVRYRGTLGGNLSHADPASDLPAAALALGATLHVTGASGSRSVSASDFFVDLMMTALQPDEILTSVEIAAAAAGTGSAYVKFEHPASGYALCGAAAVVTRGAGGSCTAASLCFNGVSSTAVSASGVASSLVGSDLSDDAIVSAVNGLSIPDATGDMFASAGYRQELAKSIGIQALLTARDRA